MRTLIAALLISFAAAASAQKADPDQDGYYYPTVSTTERFERELLQADAPADRELRQLFLAQLRREHAAAEGERRIEIFAKGSAATNLIIIALDDEVFRTIWRARAVLAGLTTEARSTDFFKTNPAAARATWFDLLKVLGFEDIVISDGATWSHLVSFK